jgi:predicted GNAT superfamily acetyltransferase
MLTSEIKNSIRIIENQKRVAISAEQKTAYDKAIFENIIALDQYISCSVTIQAPKNKSTINHAKLSNNSTQKNFVKNIIQSIKYLIKNT